MAFYRLGQREEALASWHRAPEDAPATYKAWDEIIVACLSDAPDAREVAERAVERITWTDPEGFPDRRPSSCAAWAATSRRCGLLATQSTRLHRSGPAAARSLVPPLRDDPRFVDILHRARKLAATRRWPCSAARAANVCSACAPSPDPEGRCRLEGPTPLKRVEGIVRHEIPGLPVASAVSEPGLRRSGDTLLRCAVFDIAWRGRPSDSSQGRQPRSPRRKRWPLLSCPRTS